MKVSIIVPIYNMEKRLKKCLDSIINQTEKDIEIILVNDGSTDRSLDVINEYKDDRIVLINQENGGISAARNNALKVANGEYICFLDSDDYISLDMVEKLYSGITSNDADICVCDYYMFNDDGYMEYKHVGNSKNFGSSLYEQPSLIKDIDFAPWNKIYKKELFDDIEFPIRTKYEDLEAILKVFSKAKKISKIDEALYYYYINLTGETNSYSPKNMDMLVIAKNLNDYFDFKGNDKVLNDYFFEVISQKLLYIVPQLFKIVDRKTCLKFMDDIYSFLNKNEPKWHRLYKRNNIDTNYIKFIRGHKFIFKTYAFLRMTLYKILGR